jgi:hypothetical protein
MTNDTTSLKDDISYMRRLAERGRYGPIVGGAFLMAAGVIFGTACLVQWAVLRYGNAGFEKLTMSYLWPAAWLLFGVFWVVIYYFRVHARPGVRSEANTAFGMVWIACALGITVQCAAIAAASFLLHATAVVSLIMPSVFAYYGTAWWATAAITKQRWMYAVASAAFAIALILAFMTYSLNQLPVMGAALFLTLALPGLKLMCNEPQP